MYIQVPIEVRNIVRDLQGDYYFYLLNALREMSETYKQQGHLHYEGVVCMVEGWGEDVEPVCKFLEELVTAMRESAYKEVTDD